MGVDRGRSVRLRVVIEAVAHGQVLRARQVRRDLGRAHLLAEFDREDAVAVREDPLGVDALEGVLIRPLVRAEEEDLVPADRPADAAAVLIAAVILLGHLLLLFRERSRVQRVVAAEREPAPVQGVRAALGDDVEDRAVAAAVLRVEPLGDQLEFLNRLERKHLEQAADRVVVVVAAVDDVVDVAAVAAADLRGVLRALRHVGVEAKPHPGDGRGKVGELAAVERQPLHAVDVHDLAERRRRGGDQRRRGGDGDALADAGESQLHVDRGRRRDVHFDLRPIERLEALQRGPDLVLPGRDGREPIRAGGIRRVGPDQPRLPVDSFNVDSGNRRALRVDDAATDRSRRELGAGSGWNGKDAGRGQHTRTEEVETSHSFESKYQL